MNGGRTRSRAWLAGLAAALFACTAKPPAEPQLIRRFEPTDTPISHSDVSAAEGGWQISRTAAGSVPLFEVPNPGLEYTTLTYRARLKARDVAGKAFLEMWVRIPGRGEFFSRGLDQPLQGTSDWASYQIPFFLNERGLRPDLIKLNVAFDGGGGTVWVKDVELLHTPITD